MLPESSLLYFRSFLFHLLFWADTLILSIVVLLLRPFGLAVSYTVGRTWSRLNMFLLKYICGLSYEVRTTAKLPDGPAVYLAKHQSAWETIAFPSIFPPFMWVLKKELFYIPFFGWCLKALGHIGIDRKSGARAIKTINERGRKILGMGFNIIMFPEGTRVEPGKMGPFNPGGVGLAINNGVPIVPVTHNAGRFWARRSFLKRPGKITVIIDEPIPTAGLPPSQRRKLTARVEEIIAKRLEEIGG